MSPLRIAVPVILWSILLLWTGGDLAAQGHAFGHADTSNPYARPERLVSPAAAELLAPQVVRTHDWSHQEVAVREEEAFLTDYSVPLSTNPGEDLIVAESPVLQTSLEHCTSGDDCWTFQRLPDGLMFKSYLAGEKEPRFTTVWAKLDGHGNIWDSTLGGRVGLLRWGTEDVVNPQGWQLDMEGAAMPRLDMESKNDLMGADFRFGVPITYREGPTSYKFAYYHISSHVGDEFLENNPGFQRDNFVREALALAISHEPSDFTRFYAEVAYAFIDSGNAQPWEMQFGFEYSALASSGVYSSPFMAINWHIREELSYDGNITVQAGWQWRGIKSDRLWRMGVQYYNGATSQYALGLDHEQLFGFGMWFDY